MAREYASIKLSIWSDDDWRDLTPLSKLLYLTLLTSPTLSHCGVADWRPPRIAATTGMDLGDVEGCAAEMVESLHLVIDRDSEEVLVRSFVRHDGLMKQPKMATAMASAHAAVASKALRGVVVHELKRLKEDRPELHGWGSEKASDLLSRGSIDPSTYPLGKGSTKGSTKGKATPSTKGSPTPAPTPTPTTSHLPTSAPADAECEFDEFWDAYPKKRDKGHAVKAFKAARKKATTAQILTGLRSQLPEWCKNDIQFVPNAATWLNGERWADDMSNVHHLAQPDDQGRVLLPPLPPKTPWGN